MWFVSDMEPFCDRLDLDSDCDDENLLLDDSKTIASGLNSIKSKLNGFAKSVLRVDESSWLNDESVSVRVAEEDGAVDSPLLINVRSRGFSSTYELSHI